MMRVLVLNLVWTFFMVGVASTWAQNPLADTTMRLWRQLDQEFQVNVARVERQEPAGRSQ